MSDMGNISTKLGQSMKRIGIKKKKSHGDIARVLKVVSGYISDIDNKKTPTLATIRNSADELLK
jgi:hypothetical protein